jgi:hypothetical protein
MVAEPSTQRKRPVKPRSLRRKVSDEFTVPLGRDHHLELDRYGNEVAWRANLKIEATDVARNLCPTTQRGQDPAFVSKAQQRASGSDDQGATLGQQKTSMEVRCAK